MSDPVKPGEKITAFGLEIQYMDPEDMEAWYEQSGWIAAHGWEDDQGKHFEVCNAPGKICVTYALYKHWLEDIPDDDPGYIHEDQIWLVGDNGVFSYQIVGASHSHIAAQLIEFNQDLDIVFAHDAPDDAPQHGSQHAASKSAIYIGPGAELDPSLLRGEAL